MIVTFFCLAGNSNESLEAHTSAKIQNIKHRNLSEPFPPKDEMVHVNFQKNLDKVKRADPHPFDIMNQVDQKCGRFDADVPRPYALEGSRNNISSRHYENSLFSSSLSDLFNRKSEFLLPFSL